MSNARIVDHWCGYIKQVCEDANIVGQASTVEDAEVAYARFNEGVHKLQSFLGYMQSLVDGKAAKLTAKQPGITNINGIPYENGKVASWWPPEQSDPWYHPRWDELPELEQEW